MYSRRLLKSSLFFTGILAQNLKAFSTTTATCASMTPTIKVVPNQKLFVSEPNPSWFGNGANPKNDPAWTNGNFLKSRFHFSFAEYNSALNSDFGVLRVMNDDLVQPKRGFGTHPHSDMEIITYIVDGELTHKDSMGTKETLGRGSIQFITAGTGIKHSEQNNGDKPLRFIQTWIVPSKAGLTPNYGSGTFSGESRKNKLAHLVSDVTDKSTSTAVEINQDLNAFASELDLGQKLTYDLLPGRQAYLLCIEGSVQVNGQQLTKYDACEISESGALEIEATDVEETENGKVAHILMFVMKEVRGSGRKDIQ
jgi:redox-sensitive bicupin YhaK (pirin superfamily)